MKRSALLTTLSLALLLAILALSIRQSEASSEAAQDEPSTSNFVPSAAAAVAPPVFSYQGQLTNSSGSPITNTTLPMTFRLFTVLTGGTACWTETQNVDVRSGQFNVLLGQLTSIPATCVANNAYLEMVINGETLSPRELLTSVATAAKANTLVSGASTQGDLTVTGALSVVNNLYAESAITSPGGKNLTIDAGWGSQNSLNLKENVNVAGDLLVSGADIAMAYTPRGNGGRALVHDWNDVLTLNYSGDFSGGTRIQSTLSVWGQTTIAGDLNVDLVINAAGLNVGSCKINTNSGTTSPDQTVCEGGTIVSGAYVEANLMSNEERVAKTIDRFEQGDLLCWSAEDRQLEKCSTANDPLVMGVADASGKPIVLGAEQIKVLGSIKIGDYLVASEVPGYAKASDDPSFGIVIGQALEDFEGERGLIMAMIRKM